MKSWHEMSRKEQAREIHELLLNGHSHDAEQRLERIWEDGLQTGLAENFPSRKVKERLKDALECLKCAEEHYVRPAEWGAAKGAWYEWFNGLVGK
jgi:ribulose bisphosphate carboxylase small subunit